MVAVTTGILAAVGLVLGWISIEIACKPCLDNDREAIDRNLNPQYDPDDDDYDNNNIRALLNPNPTTIDSVDSDSISTPSVVKYV
ncbi:Outer envelope membrane protein [Actinidia chinensis var. chinensis]|uniref:Outer envelope membrane protein n=1 Tax=Actinidia chinensis var. chinensis TaxID=1590841 RepID=A0A2R6RG71_ACTCC|nr:Outer envelope membrane protein [Actinidia chinensis var. chinensis]